MGRRYALASMNKSLSTGYLKLVQLSWDLFFGAVLTNAQPSIRGAAKVGARHEIVSKDAAIHPSVSRPAGAARRAIVGVVLDCCEVTGKSRWLLLGFCGRNRE